MLKPSEEKPIEEFINTLTRLGGKAGNFAMMREMKMPPNEYWSLRNKLLDRALVTLGRGRGGSVILLEAEPELAGGESAETIEGDSELSSDKYPDEASLYEPCRETLASNWASAYRLFDFRAHITARQGSKKTGGIWTRPDISAVSLRTFPYWPGRHFDLWTFEVKPRWEFNVLGLFEALSHARMATQSWALYHVEDAALEAAADDLDRMTSEAQRLGVGFVVFSDPGNFETWDIRVHSARTSPDPSLHDEFVKTQLSEEVREVLLQWSR